MIRVWLVVLPPFLFVIAGISAFVWLMWMIDRLFEGRFRFSLRSLLIVMTIAALIGGGWSWLRGQYFWQLNALNAVLATDPEVKVVHMIGNDDVWFEVEEVFFSVAGEPGKIYRIQVPHGAGESEINLLLNHALLNKRPVSVHFW